MTDWKGAFAQTLMLAGASLVGVCVWQLWGIEAVGSVVGLIILALGIRIYEGE